MLILASQLSEQAMNLSHQIAVGLLPAIATAVLGAAGLVHSDWRKSKNRHYQRGQALDHANSYLNLMKEAVETYEIYKNTDLVDEDLIAAKKLAGAEVLRTLHWTREILDKNPLQPTPGWSLLRRILLVYPLEDQAKTMRRAYYFTLFVGGLLVWFIFTDEFPGETPGDLIVGGIVVLGFIVNLALFFRKRAVLDHERALVHSGEAREQSPQT